MSPSCADELYVPNSRNIKLLRGMVEPSDTSLIDAWPRKKRRDKRCFELLKRAYAEACYSEHYAITNEELVWFPDHTAWLQEIAITVCQSHLSRLKAAIVGCRFHDTLFDTFRL